MSEPITVFEKILKGELPCNKVYENDGFLAFHDIAPKAPVHVLVVPKKKAKDIQEMDPKDMAPMMAFIQEVAKILGLHKNGYRLISNVGVDGGQEIPYLHFHLLGGGRLKWDKLAENLSEGERIDLARKSI